MNIDRAASTPAWEAHNGEHQDEKLHRMLWGFPKIGVPFFGIPKGDSALFGFKTGYPYFGKCPTMQEGILTFTAYTGRLLERWNPGRSAECTLNILPSARSPEAAQLPNPKEAQPRSKS